MMFALSFVGLSAQESSDTAEAAQNEQSAEVADNKKDQDVESSVEFSN